MYFSIYCIYGFTYYYISVSLEQHVVQFLYEK